MIRKYIQQLRIASCLKVGVSEGGVQRMREKVEEAIVELKALLSEQEERRLHVAGDQERRIRSYFENVVL